MKNELAHDIQKRAGLSQEDTGAVFLSIAESICALKMLPAVTSHDWAGWAAGAIAALGSRGGRACVMLVVDESTPDAGDAFRVELVGVRVGAAGEPGAGQSDEELAMRIRLERSRGLGLARAPRLTGAGFVGRMDDLDRSWRETTLGRVWAGVPVRGVLMGVCPIEHAGRAAVVCMFGEPEDAPVIPVEAFGSVMAVLAGRAGLLYRTMGASDGELKWLTSREQDVLDALVNGLSVREIADQLGRSRHTMHDHVKNLHKKLNASCRGELVAAALGHMERSGREPLRMPMIIGGQREPITEVKPAGSPRATPLQ